MRVEWRCGSWTMCARPGCSSSDGLCRSRGSVPRRRETQLDLILRQEAASSSITKPAELSHVGQGTSLLPQRKGATDMIRSRCTTFIARAAFVPLVALAVAGFGSVSYASASPAPQEATKAKAATVRVAKTSLGKILVNSKGRALYLFQ